jgi:hypothetical protein
MSLRFLHGVSLSWLITSLWQGDVLFAVTRGLFFSSSWLLLKEVLFLIWLWLVQVEEICRGLRLSNFFIGRLVHAQVYWGWLIYTELVELFVTNSCLRLYSVLFIQRDYWLSSAHRRLCRFQIIMAVDVTLPPGIESYRHWLIVRWCYCIVFIIMKFHISAILSSN